MSIGIFVSNLAATNNNSDLGQLEDAVQSLSNFANTRKAHGAWSAKFNDNDDLEERF